MNTTLISALIAAALGAGGAWTVQQHRIDTLKLEQANERITQQRGARATLERYMQTVAKAQANAAARSVVLRRSADAAGNAGSGLRQSSADTLRAAQADPTACRASAVEYDFVLGAISHEAERLAVEADLWESDAKTLTEEWPK